MYSEIPKTGKSLLTSLVNVDELRKINIDMDIANIHFNDDFLIFKIHDYLKTDVKVRDKFWEVLDSWANRGKRIWVEIADPVIVDFTFKNCIKLMKDVKGNDITTQMQNMTDYSIHDEQFKNTFLSMAIQRYALSMVDALGGY